MKVFNCVSLDGIIFIDLEVEDCIPINIFIGIDFVLFQDIICK
jgi:hypothetical protein